METALINHAQQFIIGGGSPARTLVKNKMNLNSLRTNDLLRKDEWEQLDTALVDVARDRLVGINDLRSAGLTVNLGGLGTILSQYEKISDMSAANVDIAGVTDGEKDAVTFSLVSVPVPIFHKDFSINIRRLAASSGPNSIGQSIDTTQVTVAGRKVAEMMEQVLFLGWTGGAVDGNTLYGYTTQTSINTEAGSDWGTVTNPEVDVVDAIDELEQDNYFGPYTIYVAKTQYGELRKFHTDGSGDSVYDRLLRIPGVKTIKPADRLTATNALVIDMKKDVVDLAVGQDLTVVEWESKGGMIVNFKVMAACAPRVKANADGGSGICQITGI